MILRIDMASETPIYVQLRNQIVLGIGRGELQLGEGLPTVRQLAQDIGVNTMTVNKAYTALKNEGYIEIDRRHGARVSPSVRLSGEFREKLEGELALLIAESGLAGMEKQDFLSLCGSLFDQMGGLPTAALER
ncbi:MAG TPA: GntR family transcriptional regulator [Candidatus Fimivicinus intestinavium]|nr:GntR family transcriptional regulator [Candidatus Fimivicinus intestinavium]